MLGIHHDPKMVIKKLETELARFKSEAERLAKELKKVNEVWKQKLEKEAVGFKKKLTESICAAEKAILAAQQHGFSRAANIFQQKAAEKAKALKEAEARFEKQFHEKHAINKPKTVKKTKPAAEKQKPDVAPKTQEAIKKPESVKKPEMKKTPSAARIHEIKLVSNSLPPTGNKSSKL